MVLKGGGGELGRMSLGSAGTCVTVFIASIWRI